MKQRIILARTQTVTFLWLRFSLSKFLVIYVSVLLNMHFYSEQLRNIEPWWVWIWIGLLLIPGLTKHLASNLNKYHTQHTIHLCTQRIKYESVLDHNVYLTDMTWICIICCSSLRSLTHHTQTNIHKYACAHTYTHTQSNKMRKSARTWKNTATTFWWILRFLNLLQKSAGVSGKMEARPVIFNFFILPEFSKTW